MSTDTENIEDGSEVAEDPTPEPIGLELVEDEDEDEASLLAEQLRETEARLRTVSAAYKGLQEDMHSFRQRVESQQGLKLDVHKGETVAKLFSPLEDLRRSIDAVEKSDADPMLISGLEMVYRAFMEGFNKLGLTEVAEKGAGFDPLYHEVLSVIPIPDPAMDGRILEVFAQGYRVGARLIRPAKVLVAQAPPSPVAAEE